MKSAMLALLALSALGAPAFAASPRRPMAAAPMPGRRTRACASRSSTIRTSIPSTTTGRRHADLRRRIRPHRHGRRARAASSPSSGRAAAGRRAPRPGATRRDRPRRSGGSQDELILEGPVGGRRRRARPIPTTTAPVESSPLPDPLYEDPFPQSAAAAPACPATPTPAACRPIAAPRRSFPARRPRRNRDPAPPSSARRARTPRSRSPRCRCCSIAPASRRASSTGAWAPTSTRRSPPTRRSSARALDATDAQSLAEQLDETGGPAIVSYTITDKDVGGPYLASIPEDYAEKAKLPAMSYTRVTEMLGERFHMDEDYLKSINPGADFNRPGTVIKVMAVGENVKEPVARIIADKGREQVRAYDAAGRLVAAYPSTIGSSDTPSPSGTVAGQPHRLRSRTTPTIRRSTSRRAQQVDPHHPARPERPGRHDLDRAVEADLRHSRHARALQDRQDQQPRLRAPRQFRRAGTRQAREARRHGRIPGIVRSAPRFAGAGVDLERSCPPMTVRECSMTIRLMTAMALILASGAAFCRAPSAPDLSQRPIDAADLAGWQARRAAAAEAEGQAKADLGTEARGEAGNDAEVEATDVPEARQSRRPPRPRPRPAEKQAESRGREGRRSFPIPSSSACRSCSTARMSRPA